MSSSFKTSSYQIGAAEIAFKQLAESVRISLQTFTALQTIPSNGMVSSPLRLALTELVNTTVRCYLFYYFFF